MKADLKCWSIPGFCADLDIVCTHFTGLRGVFWFEYGSIPLVKSKSSEKHLYPKLVHVNCNVQTI